MTFGETGTSGARVNTVKDIESILDVFKSHGHKGVCFSCLIYLRQLKHLPD
jgi:hypothetical protein